LVSGQILKLLLNNIISGFTWQTGRIIGAKLLSYFFQEDIMMKLPSKFRIVVTAAVCAVVLGATNNAVAADEAIAFGKESFKLSLGYYYPNFDSRVAVGVSGAAPPGDISPEQDLGLDKYLGGARFDGYWRFADRHRIYFGYYNLDRSASKVLDHDIGPINIPGHGEYTINTGSNINIDAKWEVFILGYTYSFYKTDSLEFAGLVGLNVAQLGTQLSGTFITSAGTFSGSTAGSTLTAPLPAIGLSGDWAIDDRWRLRGHAGAFKITINNIDAKVVDANISGEYRVWGNIWGGLGYSLLNASAGKNDGSSDVSLDWRTGGLQLYASMLF
jgi:hypothetical protein